MKHKIDPQYVTDWLAKIQNEAIDLQLLLQENILMNEKPYKNGELSEEEKKQLEAVRVAEANIDDAIMKMVSGGTKLHEAFFKKKK